MRRGKVLKAFAVLGLIAVVAAGCNGGGGGETTPQEQLQSCYDNFTKLDTDETLCATGACDTTRMRFIKNDLEGCFSEAISSASGDTQLEVQARWGLVMAYLLELVQTVNGVLHNQLLSSISLGAPPEVSPLAAIQCQQGLQITDILGLVGVDFNRLQTVFSDIDANISAIEEKTNGGADFSVTKFDGENIYLPIQLYADVQNLGLYVNVDVALYGEAGKVELEGMGALASGALALTKLILSHNTCLNFNGIISNLGNLAANFEKDIVKLLRSLPTYLDPNFLTLVDGNTFLQIPSDLDKVASRALGVLDFFSDRVGANQYVFWFEDNPGSATDYIHVNLKKSLWCTSKPCDDTEAVDPDEGKFDVISQIKDNLSDIKATVQNLESKLNSAVQGNPAYIEPGDINPLLQNLQVTLCSTCPAEYMYTIPPVVRIALHKIFPQDPNQAKGLSIFLPKTDSNGEWIIEAEAPEGTTFPTTTTSGGDVTVPPDYITIGDTPHFGGATTSDCIAPVFFTTTAPDPTTQPNPATDARIYMDNVSPLEANMILYIQSSDPTLGGVLEYNPRAISEAISAWYQKNATLYLNAYPSQATVPDCAPVFQGYDITQDNWVSADQFLNSMVLGGAQLLYLGELLGATDQLQQKMK